MTVEEFSNEFDVLYNNIMSNQAPGLNDYEKSVFLTKAQEEIVKNYFNPRGNKYQEGFDDSSKRQIDFSTLIKVVTLDTSSSVLGGTPIVRLDSRSSIYELPSDVMFVLNEMCSSPNSDLGISIMPLSNEEYTKLMMRPFKYPKKNQAWRLLNTAGTTPMIEIITLPNTTIDSYVMRYVKKPSPIILEDLATYGVSINGEDSKTECELDTILHQEILQRAIELAKIAYTGTGKEITELGIRTE